MSMMYAGALLPSKSACQPVPVLFSYGMERESLIDIILNAPAWARVGLTVPNEGLRERAAGEMADVIIARMGSPHEGHRDQLPLPL